MKRASFRRSRTRRLAILWLFSALCVLPACTTLLNGVTSREGMSIDSGVRYDAGTRGTFDIYLPETAGPSTPVVVFFYGGSWDSGDKDRYLFVGQSLADAGIIAVVPDYRLYPEVTFPGFVEDGALAVAAVLEEARRGRPGMPAGDHPLFLMGHSAGAHIAAMLTYDERYLRAAGVPASVVRGFVGLAGPYDFLPLTSDRYRRIFPPESREASQPVNFVDGSEPPALLISGAEDETVRPRNSRALAQRVRQTGGRAELQLYPDTGHIGPVAALATALSSDSAIREAVLDFIARNSTSR